jgi:hypothetical protein
MAAENTSIPLLLSYILVTWLGFQAKRSSTHDAYHSDLLFACAGIQFMAQCESKVFFPESPSQPPQFSDCPRQAETTRRAPHSVMKLCSKCARVWDEQDRQINFFTSC